MLAMFRLAVAWTPESSPCGGQTAQALQPRTCIVQEPLQGRPVMINSAEDAAE
jgi:hypothetical protein